jgi:hypothetical protein
VALTLKGTAASVTTSVSIPAHSAGDLIIVGALRTSQTSLPGIPTAGGQIPAWQSITSNTGGSIIAYAVATSSNHATGAWSSASRMFVLVISDQADIPFGGTASTGPVNMAGVPGAKTFTAPAVTMTKTDGSSHLFHFFWVANGGGNQFNVAALPAGYTQLRITDTLPSASSSWLVQKDSSTSDGAVSQATTSNGTWNTGAFWSANSIEVLAGPTRASSQLTVTATATAELQKTANVDTALTVKAVTGDPWELGNFQGLFFAYDLNGIPWTGVSAVVNPAANTVITAARSASLSKIANAQASTTATATFVVSQTRVAPVSASTTAVATFTAGGGRGQFISANLSTTATTGTPQPLYTASAFSSLFVNSLLSATGLRTVIGTANLTSTAARSANITSFGVLNTSIVATAGRTGNLVSSQRMSSEITGTATATGFLSRGQSIAAAGVTATGSSSGTVSYGASAGANLISTALFSSSIVKIRLLSGSATATAAFSASLVENTVAQAALIVAAAQAAALIRNARVAASITAIAVPAASMTATRNIRADLLVVAYREGMIDEPREIVYVAADDRKAAVQIDRNRKAHIGRHDRYAGVPANSDRTATVETTEVGQAISRDALEGFRGLFFWFIDLPMIRSSSRSYPIGEDDRSISVEAEDRDALVPATRPESLYK